MTVRLNDGDVRRAAYGKLLAHARRCPNTLVIDELGLAHGANRIDIAIINGHIRGLEIKADADNLVRLPAQVKAYGAVVDRASLIVAPRHLAGASEMVPDWWGIVLAVGNGAGAVVFRRLRDERANRAPDPMTLARLLWHREVATILRERGHAERLLRAPRATLYEVLVRETKPRLLSALVRETLKSRTGWRGRSPLS